MTRSPHGPALLGLILALHGCGRPPRAEPESAPPPYAAKVDAAVLDAMTKREMPGMTLAIIRGDRVEYAKGYGKADLASGRPMTDSTPIVIGSTSKPITALAVLRLVQQGRVALDTPITRYVPELQFRDPRGAAITLRHLLTNRSGLPVGFSGPAYRRPSEVDDGAVERLAREMTGMPLLFAPGEGYAYSNRGWSLAGYIVQRVSGTPIEEFLRREVFEPLGMTATTLEFWKVPDLTTGYAEGRAIRNHPQLPSLSREYGPSGMIVSTGRDMGRLLVAMLNEGRTVLGTQFLTPELIREAQRAQADATSELGGPTRYGLGWEVDSTFGTLTVKKAGTVNSMVTFFVMLPGQSLGLAFGFNRQDYEIIPLVPNILAILAGGEASPFPAGQIPTAAPPTAVSVPAARVDRWLGEYDTRIGDVLVYRRGDSLFTDHDGAEALLVPTSDSTFAAVNDLVKSVDKTFLFRQQAGAVTMWVGRDSQGVRVKSP